MTYNIKHIFSAFILIFLIAPKLASASLALDPAEDHETVCKSYSVQSSATNKFIYGRATYKINSGIYASRRIRIKLLITDTSGLPIEVDTLTNDKGCFYYEYDPSYKIKSVWAQAASSNETANPFSLPDWIGENSCPSSTKWDLSVMNNWLFNTPSYIHSSYKLTNTERKQNTFFIHMSSDIEKSFNSFFGPERTLTELRGYIDGGFHHFDVLISGIEMLCSADQTSFPKLTVLQESVDSGNRAAYYDATTTAIHTTKTTSLRNDDYSTFAIAHEFGHYIQDKFWVGIKRDFDIITDDADGYSHSVTKPLDRRISFLEGVPHGIGNYLSHVFTGSMYLNSFTEGTFDFSEYNVGYVMGSLMIGEGFKSVYDFMIAEMLNPPAFQTLTTFAYYYGSDIYPYLIDLITGDPEVAFADLYDSQNEIYDTATCTTIEASTTCLQMELAPYMHYTSTEVDVSEVDAKGVTIDRDGDGQRITVQENAATVCPSLTAQGDGVGGFYFPASDTVDLSCTYKMPGFKPQMASICDTELEVCGSTGGFYSWTKLVAEETLRFTYIDSTTGAEVPYWSPLSIADDDAECGHDLTMRVYKDGAPYLEASGYCPSLNLEEEGTFIVEVFTTNLTEDVLCYSLMDERGCHDRGYY